MRLIPIKPTPQLCGYFDDRDATFEAFFLLEATDNDREMLLLAGYRSFGKYYFHPICTACQACTPLRIPLNLFKASKSQRRVLKKCEEVRVSISKPFFTLEKLEIYQNHSQRFNRPKNQTTLEDFIHTFYDQAIPALEFCYYLEDFLIAVGIVAVTPHALSSVYFTYRLEYSHLSLGTFSVLKEIEYGQLHQKQFLYLGYYLKDNHFMCYKANFKPNEILNTAGKWVPFEK